MTVKTPVATTQGLAISSPRPLVVPILRAGLGMLEGMVKLVPTAEVGFLGMVRDEETLQPTIYAERLPDDLANRQCFILDPMLATGGSLLAAIEYLFDRGAVDVTAVCLIGAPEGLEAIRAPPRGATSRSCSARSTRSSTRSGTSSPASATPETASTAPCNSLVTCILCVTCKKLARMTDHSRTLTSFEAPGDAGMMMPVREVMCCRMCA